MYHYEGEDELICEKCGEPIRGEYHDGRRLCCRDCLEDMSLDELLKEFYCELETAS